MSKTDVQSNGKSKQITKLWLSGDGYSTCIIPKLIAKEYGLSKPCYIIIEKTIGGLLIKKLTIEDDAN
jgi:hypothetical protein